MHTKENIRLIPSALMFLAITANSKRQAKGSISSDSTVSSSQETSSAEEIKASIARKPPLNRSEYRRRKKDQERHARLMQQDLLSEKSK